MKPQLAEDAIIEKVVYPCIVQPKIDGVRALNLNGRLTGRSLDEFKGYGITERFSAPSHQFLDGEMTLGAKPNCTNRLCSMTTGAMGRFKDVSEMPDLHWWVFDWLGEPEWKYQDRYRAAQDKVLALEDPRIHIVPQANAYDNRDLQTLIAKFADEGYEGTIIRNPRAPYKQGRATQKGQELWRVKPWADAEILVTGITEGEMNGNEAKKNTLGRTERSSAKAGMVPNGQVGSIQGTLLADFIDPLTGRVLFKKGLPCNMAPGEMTIAEAIDFFKHPEKIVGHIAKGKHLAHGVKDVPRMFTYISHRLPEDMS